METGRPLCRRSGFRGGLPFSAAKFLRASFESQHAGSRHDDRPPVLDNGFRRVAAIARHLVARQPLAEDLAPLRRPWPRLLGVVAVLRQIAGKPAARDAHNGWNRLRNSFPCLAPDDAPAQGYSAKLI